MTTTTRKTETENLTIEISLTREVNDKVAYMDGWNLPAGREVYETYEIKITSKRNGATITTSGKPGDFAFFALQGEYSGKYPAGAYARVGDAYVSQATYDLAMSMIAELAAEVSKTTEQIALEQTEIAHAATVEAVLDTEAAEYARQIENGLCLRCGSYCYGDCTTN